MLKKVVVAVAAAMACASVAQAAGNEWEVHGYARLGGQWDGSFNNNMTTYGKTDYKTVTSNDENNNQLEVILSKKTKVKGDVWSNFVVRAEYGNENAGDRSTFSSSEGSAHSKAESGQFEVKEAYIEMGGFDFLDKETKIWTGQRFLNRSQGLLSKEFWKQSSGVGFGFENGKFGVAMVSNDPASSHSATNQNGNTKTSFDVWYSGLEVPGGNLQFDAKYIKRANTPDPVNGSATANDGFGGAVTYNTNWYGLKGWTQNVIAYGTGLASNRGVNVGSWNSDFQDETSNLFLTSYGVADLTDRVQLATEVTYFGLKKGWGQKTVDRYIFAVQPSVKLNSFSRAIFTVAYAEEKLDNPGGWGRTVAKDKFVSLDAAVAFTVNSDYFGRPQIKPFVSYVQANSVKGGQEAKFLNDEKNKISWGVEGEIWF